MTGPDTTLALLLRFHDGDDRCGCLAAALLDLSLGLADVDQVTDRIRECLDTHPSGLTRWRPRR